MIEVITEFGIDLVERQHKFFHDNSIDNSEHIPAIKRIADAAYDYLKRKGTPLDKAKQVKQKLINHGNDLFVKEWMEIEEGDEPLGEEDRQEARETFDKLLRKKNR
jgi:hypothetical protein